MSDFPRYREPRHGALPAQRLRTELRPELDARFVESRAATLGLFADVAHLISLVAGCGRVMTPDDARNAATKPVPGAGLTVQLPVGYDAVIQGQPFTLAQALALDGVPPGATSYGYLSLDVIEANGAILGYTTHAIWSANVRPDLVALGQPCIGKVTADALRVSEVDVADETVIWNLPLLQRRLLAFSTSGGGDGGTGTGGPHFATQLPISETDAVDTKDYIDEGNAERDAKIALLSGAADVFPAPFDVLADHIAILMAGLSEVNPPAIERGQISVITANAGLGQSDTPNYSPDTHDPLELPWDAVTGLFGP